ncbi:MAG: DUF5666 domain-containing protein [Patescibacteria group bacterium]
MKKIIYLLSFIALLGLALPALANEDAAATGSAEVKSDKAVAVYEPRVVNFRGQITGISGSVLPADVTLKLEQVSPKKLKNYAGTFPAKGNSIVLHLTSDTKSVRKYSGQADFSELAVGDKVSASGKLQADGTVNATMIKDNSIHVTFNAKRGIVMTIDPAAKIFTIKNENKEFKVYVADATKFAKAGVEKPTLADLKIGDAVNVRGVIRQAANEINADYVLIKVGENEKQLKRLELKKQVLEKALARVQAELAAVLKKIEELKGGVVVTPAPVATSTVTQ